ncbi:MAG TPA: hypothetical protein VNI78_07475 [Vicinamibacterales bacterium]|nr:hypothetical protein [Vicinamibacterales bacterium]
MSPRGSIAFDLFGTGRTALKVNAGKYLEPASNLNGNYSISNPIACIAARLAGRRGSASVAPRLAPNMVA